MTPYETVADRVSGSVLDADAHSPSFILVSLLGAYPGPLYANHVRTLLMDPVVDATFREIGSPAWPRLREMLEQMIDHPTAVEDVASAYIDLFDRARGSSSLYETEYGKDRSMVKGTQLVDIAGFYKAFGLDFGAEEGQREMLDHVSVELEFYALMVMKTAHLRDSGDQEGFEIVLDGRKKFLKDHLGRFVRAIADRPQVREQNYFSSVFEACRDLVLAECKKLGVEPLEATWEQTLPGDEEITCGSTGKVCQ